MSTDLFGNPTLIGLKVRIDRPIDRERPCCSNVCTIGAARGPHAGELICAGCGQHRSWLSQPAARWIESVIMRFGAPTTPIIVRRFDEEAPHASNGEADKQRRIEEINTLIALEGFASKDFFLTQLPPPAKKTELARWRAREQRRRPIARRMALLGLKARDLAREPISVTRKPPTATADLMSPIITNANAAERFGIAMPNIDDFYPSKYLRASDLEGKEIDVTIDHVTSEEFEQDGVKRPKPVVYFRGNGIKPLICNKTNATKIATALGNKDYDTWAGKRVRLYPDMEDYRGKVHEVVRVRQAPKPAKEELNDDVPY